MTPSDSKLHTVTAELERAPAPGPQPALAPARGWRKRRVLAVVGVLLVLALGGFGAHVFLTRGDEGTDDAFVEADVVAVAPRVGGTVTDVLVQENAAVRKDQPILKLDDADYQARARQAQAELDTARAQASVADAQVRAARATVSKADAEAEKADLDLRRAEELRKGDAIAAERFDATRIAGETAHAGASTNRAQYAAALASAELAHARVKSAQAALDLAKLQLSYTTVYAAADGAVSRLGARVGQIVQPGQVLGQLVPTRTYLVANFKETQTGAIRPGQKVEIEIDAYPGKKLEGKIDSISGGTGARFSLLPPDNASGNFVKVVERVPVRIEWVDLPADLPLRAGLSATVTVHTR
jgi:membrane fusion protein (multidrug efflux system)